jgi:hypothetical protein
VSSEGGDGKEEEEDKQEEEEEIIASIDLSSINKDGSSSESLLEETAEDSVSDDMAVDETPDVPVAIVAPSTPTVDASVSSEGGDGKEEEEDKQEEEEEEIIASNDLSSINKDGSSSESLLEETAEDSVSDDMAVDETPDVPVAIVAPSTPTVDASVSSEGLDGEEEQEEIIASIIAAASSTCSPDIDYMVEEGVDASAASLEIEYMKESEPEKLYFTDENGLVLSVSVRQIVAFKLNYLVQGDFLCVSEMMKTSYIQCFMEAITLLGIVLRVGPFSTLFYIPKIHVKECISLRCDEFVFGCEQLTNMSFGQSLTRKGCDTYELIKSYVQSSMYGGPMSRATICSIEESLEAEILSLIRLSEDPADTAVTSFEDDLENLSLDGCFTGSEMVEIEEERKRKEKDELELERKKKKNFKAIGFQLGLQNHAQQKLRSPAASTPIGSPIGSPERLEGPFEMTSPLEALKDVLSPSDQHMLENLQIDLPPVEMDLVAKKKVHDKAAAKASQDRSFG